MQPETKSLLATAPLVYETRPTSKHWSVPGGPRPLLRLPTMRVSASSARQLRLFLSAALVGQPTLTASSAPFRWENVHHSMPYSPFSVLVELLSFSKIGPISPCQQPTTWPHTNTHSMHPHALLNHFAPALY
ncbi:hypothetical protein IQ07DRAFT_14292 [Pyrenochaeta sp. DS3sAY3a]|nr:hypothetical protein IQ07DRAFT_14292 [Pyrenochaeta sp. DS3sAY3a]